LVQINKERPMKNPNHETNTSDHGLRQINKSRAKARRSQPKPSSKSLGSKPSKSSQLGNPRGDSIRKKRREVTPAHPAEVKPALSQEPDFITPAEFAAANNLGKEIAYWDAPFLGEGSQYLFRKGTVYHLVKHRILVRDGDAWIEQGEYMERHPGIAGFQAACSAPRNSNHSTRKLSWAEAAQWLYETLVSGMIPAEFHEAFRPRVIAGKRVAK
jgi:hypothetical protein